MWIYRRFKQNKDTYEQINNCNDGTCSETLEAGLVLPGGADLTAISGCLWEWVYQRRRDYINGHPNQYSYGYSSWQYTDGYDNYR